MLHLGNGVEPVVKALKEYDKAWKAFLVVYHAEPIGTMARPTTLSWKVADKAELFTCLEDNAAHIEQVHIGTVNDRYIASAALKQPFEGLPILKILERRPGSTDPLGLDSIDYLIKDKEKVFTLLEQAGAAIERQHNDVHDWLSLRFGDRKQYEAKFTDHLVLEVAIKELNISVENLL